MAAIHDFRHYWARACEASGGSAPHASPWRMESPVDAMPLNGILRFGGRPDAVADEVARHTNRGLPFTWYVGPDEGADIAAAVKDAGLAELPGFTPVVGPVVDQGPVALEPVDASNVMEWVEILAEAHEIPREQHAGIAAAEMAGSKSPHRQSFLLRDQGTAVATAVLYTETGVAGIYGVTVRNNARRRGHGTTITNGLMHLAAKQGLTRCVGMTTADGNALARSRGFPSRGHLRQFVWFPDSTPLT